MVAGRGAELFESGQLAPPRPADPALEQGLGRGAVGDGFVDAPQPFLETLGAGGLQVAALQLVHGVDLAGVPSAWRLERTPAAVLEFRVVLDLGVSHLVQRLVGQCHDVEGIEADGGIRLSGLRSGLIGAGRDRCLSR